MRPLSCLVLAAALFFPNSPGSVRAAADVSIEQPGPALELIVIEARNCPMCRLFRDEIAPAVSGDCACQAGAAALHRCLVYRSGNSQSGSADRNRADRRADAGWCRNRPPGRLHGAGDLHDRRRQDARRYALRSYHFKANRAPRGTPCALLRDGRGPDGHDYLEMIGAAIEVAMCRKALRSSSPVVVL